MEAKAGKRKHGESTEEEARKKSRSETVDCAMQTDETPPDHAFQQKMLTSLLEQPDSNGNPPLHQAVLRQDREGIKNLLAAGAALNATNKQGKTALTLAAIKNLPWIATLLASKPGIHLNAADCNGYTDESPLHRAIKRGSFAMTEILLKAGASIHGTVSPLHHWAKTAHKIPSIATLLIENRVPVYQENAAGEIALDIVVSSQESPSSFKAAQFLLEKGANIFRRSRKTGLSVYDRVAGSTSPVASYIQNEWQQRLLAIAASLHLKMGLPIRLVKQIMNKTLENTPPNVCRVIEHGSAEAVEQLFHRQFTQVSDLRDRTPLHHAALNGKSDTATLLLDRGANIDAKDNNGLTPLHHAALNGQVATATLLLDRRAMVDAKDSNDLIPLHAAVLNGQVATATLLLDRGAMVDAKTKNGLTPLHAAVLNGQVATATLLLDHEANPNARNIRDHTPLHYAVGKGHVAIATLLLDHEANPNARTAQGATPLHYAADYGQVATATLLLDHEVNPNAPDTQGRTPLHIAAFHGQGATATLLLGHGAIVDAKDNNGRTPLHHAAFKTNKELMQLLIARGANPSLTDSFGKTPEDYFK